MQLRSSFSFLCVNSYLIESFLFRPTEEQLASAALAKAEHDAKKTKTVDFLRQFEESKASQENDVKLASLNVNGSENSSNSTLSVAKQAPSSPSSVFGSHISSKKPVIIHTCSVFTLVFYNSKWKIAIIIVAILTFFTTISISLESLLNYRENSFINSIA